MTVISRVGNCSISRRVSTSCSRRSRRSSLSSWSRWASARDGSGLRAGRGSRRRRSVPPDVALHLCSHGDGLVQLGLEDRARISVTDAEHLVLYLAQYEVDAEPRVAPVAVSGSVGSVGHEIRLRRGRRVGQHRSSRRPLRSGSPRGLVVWALLRRGGTVDSRWSCCLNRHGRSAWQHMLP
jgi:hypothetical protein